MTSDSPVGVIEWDASVDLYFVSCETCGPFRIVTGRVPEPAARRDAGEHFLRVHGQPGKIRWARNTPQGPDDHKFGWW